MCGVQERMYSICFSGNLSSTQFVSVTAVLQFFYIDSSIFHGFSAFTLLSENPEF